MNCGTALERRCPSCGTPAAEGAKFCMECGAELAGASAAQSYPRSGASVAQASSRSDGSAARAPLPEERRQVTVLFADITGYTAMSEAMDPEAVKALVDRCLRRLGQEVERFGGTVDKYIGDNVMAIFGAPVAHEDDAERAVRSALGMQAALRETAPELSLRVGVNTGEVLAGAVAEGGYTVIGDTVNVASRLQSAAEIGSITVGERTVRATAEAVEYRRLDPLMLKGKSEPVPAWQAVGLLAATPRRTAGMSASPFVGRDHELELLERLYGRVVRDGRAHLVTVIGQAGVGKSRLLRELERRLAGSDSPPIVREGRCLPYGSGVVYWALGEIVRAEASIVDTDSADSAWRKLCRYVEDLRDEPAEEPGMQSRRMAALIGRLLGIESPPEATEAEAQDPQRMREAFFSAARFGIEARTRRSPLVFAFEDIHWADHGMLDLIEHLARWVRGPLLILCFARDELLERRSDWGGGRRDATSIFLEPLTGEESRELVSALLPDGANGSSPVVSVVAERAGGNPFFAEEMVRRLAEEGAETADTLPDTVHALLAARLDSLDPLERHVVQQAAVVGQTFWEGALAPVAHETGADLAEVLASLHEKDIVTPLPGAGDGLTDERELAFKHVLIRDVAYGMLPKAVRCRKHFEVGNFIEQRAGDRGEEVATLLAEHYARAAVLGDEAGLSQDELAPVHRKALHFLEQAGDQAAALFSNEEAVHRYSQARQIRCPHDPEAIARIGEKEGDVALRMGHVDEAITVWTECLEYQRGQEALERVGDLHRKIGAALWHKGETRQAIEHYQKGINLLKDGPPCLELVRLYEEAASLYMHTGDNMLAIYASEKALRLAERLGETRAASRAHGIFGRVFGRIGDTAKARENLEKSVELARGSDHGETIRSLLTLGYHLEVSEADYEAAARAYEEALKLAERTGDLPSLVELHSAMALLAAYGADWEAAARSTEASVEVAEREGLLGKLSFPYGLRGLLLWHDGALDEAERAYRRAQELAEQVGWSEIQFTALFGLALVLRDGGDYTAAVAALDRALDICERAGLVAQSVQVMAMRAVILALAGRRDAACEAADEAAALAERLHYPVGEAAALEARGATTDNPDDAKSWLTDARQSWLAIGRPLEAARCDLLAAVVLREADPDAADAAAERAASEYGRLGVPHMAAKATGLVASSQ
jgi:class 3 adenylate cyclase/tetratricopeptide (TPR) repeat protein